LQILKPREEIEPFYFGTPDKPLFGCHHAPQSGPPRDCSIILCPPMGHEHINSYRALRHLAIRLSKVGFHVLRFDYYGCGDSGGDGEEGTIAQWTSDILTAIDEIRSQSGADSVCLVGLRLGATLSMMASAERGNIDGLVLWDAVVDGRDYTEKLIALHRKTAFQYSPTKSRNHRTGEKTDGVMGFPFTELMHRELDKIDLLEIQEKPANHVLLIESREEESEGRLREHLKSLDADLSHNHIIVPQIRIEDINKLLMPHQIIQAVVSWISEVYP
jgi:uncharacterized protein